MLVLVMITAATACLVAGLLNGHIWLVWTALAITLAGGVLLGFVVLAARRVSRSAGESGEAEPGERPDGERVTGPRPAGDQQAEPPRADDLDTEPPEAPDVQSRTHTAPNPTGAAPDSDDDRMVRVVSGGRRFHLKTCRVLAGRASEEIRFDEAREEGLSPCSVCRPGGESRGTKSAGSRDNVAVEVKS